MSGLNPEYRENPETKYEVNKFSPDLEKKMLQALNDKKEVFPDVVLCPNQSCGNPLTVVILENYISCSCANCGCQKILQKTIK